MSPESIKPTPITGDAGNSAESIPQDSEKWANLIKPIAYWIFGILTGVIFFPFLIFWLQIIFSCEPEKSDAYKNVLDWAKMVLSPVVGFCASAVGYYFGTR